MRELSLAVVGADHPNKRGPARKFELAICQPGERVDLVPEPKNPADDRAVAVFSMRGIQIGYLTAERCGWVGGMMARGTEVRAIFQEATPFGAIIRATLDGSDPVLPPPKTIERERSASVDDSGFFPDPIWDDD